jgi:hypothetical protein
MGLFYGWNHRINKVFLVFNATFNNISAISWQSVLFMEDKVQDFRIYLIALRCEGVIIPQKNCCGRIIKKLMPIIFQDVTGNSFFRPKISDVSTFIFDELFPFKAGKWVPFSCKDFAKVQYFNVVTTNFPIAKKIIL